MFLHKLSGQTLNKSEADQNTPERLRKLGEIDRYYERFNEEQRRDLNVARGKARAVRDSRVDVLLERVKNREDNLKALAKAQADGEPTAVFKRNIAGIDAPIREQTLRVAQAGQAYAALAGLPHPDIDKRSAALQEDMELAERNSGRFGVDLAMGLAGGVAGVAAKTLGKEAAKRVAGRVGAGVGMAEAGVAFSRNVQDRVGKEIAKAGIDASDPAAVRKFAEANKGLLQDATNRALIAAVGGKFSKSAAGYLSKLIGGNAFVRDGVEAGIKKGIDAGIGIFSKRRQRKKQ